MAYGETADGRATTFEETRAFASIAEGRTTTSDLGGSAGTSQFADAVIERLQSAAPSGTPASAVA